MDFLKKIYENVKKNNISHKAYLYLRVTDIL